MEDLNNEEYILSTIDNPRNPFPNFTDWFSFATLRGCNCGGRLAVLCNIKALYDAGYTQAEIAEKYGVSATYISKIVHGKVE